MPDAVVTSMPKNPEGKVMAVPPTPEVSAVESVALVQLIDVFEGVT